MGRFSRTQSTALTVRAEAPQLPPCNNAEVIRQWWQSKGSERTQNAYQKDAQCFLACVGERPLNYISLDNLKDYQRTLAEKGLQPASIARRLSAIKSLLTFGCTLFPAFFPVNVGAAFKIKSGKDTLAERILSEEAAIDLLAMQRRADDDPFRDRNSVLLRLLYKAALRREEVCQLSWRDVQDREQGQGQITVYGKGGKTRTILIEDASLYRARKRSGKVRQTLRLCSSHGVGAIPRASTQKKNASAPIRCIGLCGRPLNPLTSTNRSAPIGSGMPMRAMRWRQGRPLRWYVIRWAIAIWPPRAVIAMPAQTPAADNI